MACFWSNLHYIAHSSTRGFSTLTRAHGLMKGQEWLKWMEIVNYGKRKPNHVKCWILTFSARYARADMYGRKILKCSKRPETCSPLFRKWFWAILNFDARAHARIWESPDMDRPVCWHMAWSLWALNMADLGWMVMKIWMITWIHKMAPRSRHGWVIRLKSFSRFLIMAKILENF